MPVREPSESDVELHGTELVVGSTIDEVGLLVLDSDGGEATWRPLRDLRDAPWTSGDRLPAFAEAHSLGFSLFLQPSLHPLISFLALFLSPLPHVFPLMPLLLHGYAMKGLFPSPVCGFLFLILASSKLSSTFVPFLHSSVTH